MRGDLSGKREWIAGLNLLPIWLAAAWWVSKAQWFWIHREDLHFGWVLLLLSMWSFLEKWRDRPAAVWRGNIWSASVAAFAVLELLLVQIYQAAFGTNAASMAGLSLGLLAFIVAYLDFVFGLKGAMSLAFPFVFALVSLPLPSLIYNPVVSFLQANIAQLNVQLLNLSGIPAWRAGSVIQLSHSSVGIDDACSGMRGLQSSLMVSLFLGKMILRRMMLIACLAGFGWIFAVAANLARSFALCWIANASGTAALHRWHEAAGWADLILIVSGVFVAASVLSRIDKRLGPPLPGTRSEPADRVAHGSRA